LEKDGIDIFDLRLELKMALDKVKSGGFNMVNIYLEGLAPRIKSNWDKLGKQPEKRRIKLVTESELREELEKAKEARKKFEEGQKSGSKAVLEKEEKILRLKNGIVVAKKNELIDALAAMDDDTFKQHVTEQKNDFSDWLIYVDKQLSEKIKNIKTRKELLDAVKQHEIQNQ